MKNEKFFILIIISLCVIFGFVSLRMNLNRFEADSEFLFEVPPNLARERFFRFSPTEEFVLDQRRSLWPELFSTTHPPTASELPLLYRKLLELPQSPELTAIEIMELRQWSILANSDHPEALKTLLLEEVENEKKFLPVLNQGSGRPLEPCSLRNQDRAFRLYQASLFRTESEKFLLTCNPRSAHAVAFKLQRMIESKSLEKLETLSAELQALMSLPAANESFSRWYALELFQIVHILKNQSNH
jgi:hypothetical protein